jgi:hypothetical protein
MQRFDAKVMLDALDRLYHEILPSAAGKEPERSNLL